MDIDLMKDRVAGINESMRRIRRNDDDAACFHFTLFVSDRDDGGTNPRTGRLIRIYDPETGIKDNPAEIAF